MISKVRGRGRVVASVESSVEGSAREHSTRPDQRPEAVGARIAEARGRRTQAQFAELLGVAEGTVGRYERGERLPDAEFVIAMVERANISSHWLLFGEPPREVIQYQAAARAADGPRVEQPAAGYVQIPLYDVRAGAGRGKFVETEHVIDALAFKEDWIRHELRASPADLRLINVSGDSMEPDLRAGDIILIDHTDATATREGIYVIRMDGALLVKQLQRLPGGLVRVVSRNPAYEPFTVPVAKLEAPNGFAVIGRVVWACRRF